MPGAERVARIELESSERAPYIARRMVGAVVDRGPGIKAVDAALLTSELVSTATSAPGMVLVEVFGDQSVFRVEVSAESSQLVVDDLGRSLLDRLADRWDLGPPAWFELDLVRKARRPELSNDELWGLFGDDRAVRDELFERYAGFASAVASRFHRSAEYADVNQVAMMALVGALDRYDISRGVRFETYASQTIIGELKRYLRDSTWAMRVPRTLKESVLLVSSEKERLSQELARAPTDGELAEATGLAEDEVREALLAGEAYVATSLDSPVNDETCVSVVERLGGEDPGMALTEEWRMIEPALEALSERDQQILYMRFFEDMSQSEIADVLGVSQVQVSRLLAAALESIKETVDGEAV